jgi:hypothetical protein
MAAVTHHPRSSLYQPLKETEIKATLAGPLRSELDQPVHLVHGLRIHTTSFATIYQPSDHSQELWVFSKTIYLFIAFIIVLVVQCGNIMVLVPQVKFQYIGKVPKSYPVCIKILYCHDVSSNILHPSSREGPMVVNDEIKNWISQFCTILVNRSAQSQKCTKIIPSITPIQLFNQIIFMHVSN